MRTKLYLKIAVFINILSEVSFASQLIFLCVLADNQVSNLHFWSTQVFVLLIIGFILMILQIFIFVEHRKYIKNSDK